MEYTVKSQSFAQGVCQILKKNLTQRTMNRKRKILYKTEKTVIISKKLIV